MFHSGVKFENAKRQLWPQGCSRNLYADVIGCDGADVSALTWSSNVLLIPADSCIGGRAVFWIVGRQGADFALFFSAAIAASVGNCPRKEGIDEVRRRGVTLLVDAGLREAPWGLSFSSLGKAASLDSTSKHTPGLDVYHGKMICPSATPPRFYTGLAAPLGKCNIINAQSNRLPNSILSCSTIYPLDLKKNPVRGP